MISANILAIFYLISGVLFILALRGLSSSETSRQGNLFGIVGMAIAIIVTIFSVGNEVYLDVDLHKIKNHFVMKGKGQQARQARLNWKGWT